VEIVLVLVLVLDLASFDYDYEDENEDDALRIRRTFTPALPYRTPLRRPFGLSYSAGSGKACQGYK
jgi:hypothetical protein